MRRRSFNKLTLSRTQLLMVVFFVIGAIIIMRLFYLQILEFKHFGGVAASQHRLEQVLLQRRGEIFMHDFKSKKLVPAVINRNLSLLYAVPKEIKNPDKLAEFLANIFEDKQAECSQLLDSKAGQQLINKCDKRKKLKQEMYIKLTKKDDPYEPLRHKVAGKEVNLIKAENFEGIYFEDEWLRFYPEEEKAAQITGFLGYQGDVRVGQYGVEGYFEKELAGEAGKLLGNKDLFGRPIPVAEQELIKAKDGQNIILTLDKIIQTKAFEIIRQAVEDYGAENGNLIVMDPTNGFIKAMVGYPSFNPNDYSQVEDIGVYKNLNISQAYEPGSIFKIITMAAGLDSGAVQPNETYIDEGFVQIGEHTISNADNKKYGKINMTQVLENSVNTGAVYVILKTGKNTFRQYVKNFGFGQLIGIGLDGEVSGKITSLEKKGDIYMVTASYGQGLTVTPLQMASAMSTIVNNGRLVLPKIIETVNGDVLPTLSQSGQQVISEKTSQTLKAMLVSVVKNGHGSRAQVPGYYIGGKTGTAEIAAKAGGYSNENNHSFVGFGPLDNTKFVIMVKLSRPKWGKFSAVTAAPTFQKMASFLLQYYQLPPEYKE